jgi:cyclohexa-1,5-dienecarbonyl-CoA hydratase
MDFQTIQLHPGPRLVSIVLDRAPLNVINIQMIDELNAAWKEVIGLKAGVVVMSGAGDRAFSAGVEVADHSADKIGAMLPGFHDLVRRIHESDCVTIAAVHGHTLGGGAELTLVCDFIVAADDTQFGFPEVQLGCFAPVAAASLPRIIGPARAAEMLYLGKPLTAEEAHRAGLFSRVVPREALSQTVDELAATLLEKSAPALRLTKRALRLGMERRFQKALDKNETLFLKQLMKTADAQEGLDAFLQKRPPSWKNK